MSTNSQPQKTVENPYESPDPFVSQGQDCSTGVISAPWIESSTSDFRFAPFGFRLAALFRFHFVIKRLRYPELPKELQMLYEQKSEQESKLLVRAPEAAKMLSISTRKLSDLVRGNLIPSIKQGRSRLFYIPALDKWCQNNLKGFNDGNN